MPCLLTFPRSSFTTMRKRFTTKICKNWDTKVTMQSLRSTRLWSKAHKVPRTLRHFFRESLLWKQLKGILVVNSRLDVGGRLLTNYLKEILSFRHLDLKNSDRLIKQIKEDLGFVSSSLIDDMRCKKGTFLKHFILPDDELKKKGYAVDILD
jgi:hypothetical protein